MGLLNINKIFPPIDPNRLRRLEPAGQIGPPSRFAELVDLMMADPRRRRWAEQELVADQDCLLGAGPAGNGDDTQRQWRCYIAGSNTSLCRASRSSGWSGGETAGGSTLGNSRLEVSQAAVNRTQ